MVILQYRSIKYTLVMTHTIKNWVMKFGLRYVSSRYACLSDSIAYHRAVEVNLIFPVHSQPLRKENVPYLLVGWLVGFLQIHCFHRSILWYHMPCTALVEAILNTRKELSTKLYLLLPNKQQCKIPWLMNATSISSI